MIVKGRRNIKTGGCKAINYTSSKVITETGIFWIMQTLSLFFSRQEYKYQHHKYKTQTFSNGWKLGHSCDLSNIDGTNVLGAQRCFINMIWRIYNCAKNWVRNIYGKYHKYYVCCHWSLRPTVGVDVLKTKVRQLKFCLTDFSAALLTYFHVCLFLFHWVGKDHPTDVFSPPYPPHRPKTEGSLFSDWGVVEAAFVSNHSLLEGEISAYSDFSFSTETLGRFPEDEKIVI